jgi:hypothetical protein
VRGVGRRVEAPDLIGEGAAARDDKDRPGCIGENRNKGRSATEEGAAELDHERAHGELL